MSYALRGILSAHVSPSQLTSAQAIPVLRHIFNIPCACLDLSNDMCAEKPNPALWEASPLHTSPRVLSKSMAGHGARTCRSYIMLAYNEIQKALVCGPYFRVGSTNKVYL